MTATKEILKQKGHLVYSDSYLKSMPKDWLIKYIRCLEHNWANAEQCCDHQYKLLTECVSHIDKGGTFK